MRSLLTALFTAMLFCAPAWAQDAAPADAQAGAVDPSEVKIELVEPGEGDRVELRYHPKVGESFDLEMRMDTSMTMLMGGQEMPAQPIPSTVTHTRMTVESVSDGQISYSLEVLGAKSEGGMMAEQLNAAMEGLVGLTGHGVVTTRGQSLSFEIDAPEDLNPMVGQQMQAIEGQMRNIGVVLPEEAVGAGATWKVTTPVRQGGPEMRTEAVYSLASHEGGVLKLGVEITQTAEPQEIKSDEIPADMTLNLDSLKGTGSAETVLDLGWIVPKSSAVDHSIDMVMTAGQFGQMQQSMRMQVKLAGSRAEGDS